jgi:heat shock protein HslJ
MSFQKRKNFVRTILIAFFFISIAGCAAKNGAHPAVRSRDPQAVLGKTWQWVETITPVEKITVPNPERYTILLRDGGKLQAQFDCNSGGGTYRISEGKLSFGPLVSTRMACPPGSLDGPYMRDLQRVVSFFIENGNLYLELPLDSGTMRFLPAH